MCICYDYMAIIYVYKQRCILYYDTILHHTMYNMGSWDLVADDDLSDSLTRSFSPCIYPVYSAKRCTVYKMYCMIL